MRIFNFIGIKMLHKNIVKTSTLLLACILLLGIISIAFGFYKNDSILIGVGISITLLTSLTINFQNIFHLKSNHKR